jgi:hypothetical protein
VGTLHVRPILDMRRDGAAWRFASSVDCGAFVASVDEAARLCDPNVYRQH